MSEHVEPGAGEVRMGEESAPQSRKARAWAGRTTALVAREYGIYVALILLIGYFAAAAPAFRTIDNLFLVLRQTSVNGILAVGMTFVILTAGIDLSIGSLLAIAGLVSGVFARQDPTMFTVSMAFLMPFAVGLIGGALNGTVIAFARVSPLIVTLGTLTAYRGFAQWYRVNPIYDLHGYYRWIGTHDFGRIPALVVVYVLLVLVASLVLNRTRFGRQVYAVGGNEEAARAAGINVARVKLTVYMISGFCVGLASLIYTSRLGAAQSISGTGFELQAIAAVVLGGTSLFGGRGRLLNTVIGTLIIGVLFNGLVILNVASPIQLMVIGGIIVGAVWLDGILQRTTR